VTNVTCATAQPLASCNETIQTDNRQAPPECGTPDPDTPADSPSCQWQGDPTAANHSLWFTFVATDVTVDVRTCNTDWPNVPTFDTIIALYEGTCGNLVELACGEDECPTAANPAEPWYSNYCFWGLTVDETYYVYVATADCAGGTPGPLTVDIQCPGDCGPPTGACCIDDPISPQCVDDVLQEDCTGRFGGVDSTCANPPFDPGCTSCGAGEPGPCGACCIPGTPCAENISELFCEAAAGGNPYEWWHMLSCGPDPCVDGACCDDITGDCVDGLRYFECDRPAQFSGGELCNELDPPCESGCPEAGIHIFLFTDDYASETSWALFDHDTGVIVADSTATRLLDFTLYSWLICVPADGCYDFTIYDSFGDGICCEFGDPSATGSVASSATDSTRSTTTESWRAQVATLAPRRP
jgi:hypothetical protein